MSRLMEVLRKIWTFYFVKLLSFGQTKADFSEYLQFKVKDFSVVALGGGSDN